MTTAVEILISKVETWFRESVAALPNFFVAVLVVILFYYLAKVAKRVFYNFLVRFSVNKTLNDLMASSVQLSVIFVGVFIALGILNLEKTVTSLLTGAGIITFVIGFAFQDIASNFFSGILIAFKKPYQIGDVIEIDKNLGIVEEIELRSTMLRTFDGQDILIPNKNILTQVVTNYTFSPYRRVVVLVGVAYNSDLSLVEKVTTQALESIPEREKSQPIEVFFTDFGASSINLTASFWMDYQKNKAFGLAKHKAVIAINEAYKKNGISIPYPITQIIQS